MSYICASRSCKSHELNSNIQNVVVFPFPDDEDICKQWILRSGRQELLEKNIAEIRLSGIGLCERHFEEHCLDRSGMIISLKPKAKPTLFDHDISEFASEISQEKTIGSMISPDIVVIPCVIMDETINTEVIGYDGEMIKEETDDGNTMQRHLQLMEDGSYVETQVIAQNDQGIVISDDINSCLQPVTDDATILESATIVVDSIHTVENSHWQNEDDENLTDQLCRVCAKKNDDLVPVFGEEGISLQLIEKIQWHLPIVVKADDKLPVKMCTPCIMKLNSCHELISSCLEADVKLRKLLRLEEEPYDESMCGDSGTSQASRPPSQSSSVDPAVSEMVEVYNSHSFQHNGIPNSTVTFQSKENIIESRSVRRQPLKVHHISRAMDLLRKAKESADIGGDLDESLSLRQSNQVSDEVTVDCIEADVIHSDEEHGIKEEISTIKQEIVNNSYIDGRVLEVCIESGVQPGTNEVHNFQMILPDDGDPVIKSKSVESLQDIMQNEEDINTFRERRRSLRFRELRCDLCGYEAPRKSSLLLHKRRKHPPPQYMCNYCDKTFSNAIAMRVHERTHTRLQDKTPEPTLFMCEFCGKSFRGKKTLKEHHLAVHSDEKPYKCDKCDKNYGSLSSLDIHKATHSSETPYLCDLCGKTFKHVSNLRSHKRSHLDDMDKNRQVCCKCGKGFRSRFHLSEHLNVHNGVRPYGCDICGKRFHKKIQLRQHGSAHSGTQPYKCPICGVKFNRRGNMTQHIKRHDQERKYTCRVCGETFPTLGAVLNHRKRHTESEVERSIQQQAAGDDPDQVAFKCEICGKLLAKKESLTTHMRSHTGEKLFECTVCGKRLSNKGSLTYHMRSFHTGERPHTCQFCGEGFLSKEARMVHERIHTGEKPYKCGVCSMAFRCSSNLAQHAWVHSDARPHPCPHCGKHFQRKGALDVHMRTHTGERPYVCDMCNRGFTQKNDMLKHRRTHTNEKPFRCQHCGQIFSQKRDLLKHQVIHTGEQVAPEPMQTVVITTADNLLTSFPEINVPVMENPQTQTIILHRY